MNNRMENGRVPEIGLIAPSQSLADLTRQAAGDRGLICRKSITFNSNRRFKL